MNILISGVTGFVGSHVAEVLAKRHNVYAVTRGGINTEIQGIKYFDIRRSIIPQADVFIHCAWGGVNAIDRDNSYIQPKNIELTLSMLEVAKRSGCGHFIGIGSQAEYGQYSGRINENQPVIPNTPYGMAKVVAYSHVRDFCNRNGILWNWFRLFSVYGEREKENWFIPYIITKALLNEDIELTGCEQKYDYLYAPEIGRAIELAIESKKYGVFNLSSNESIELKQIVQYILDYTGSKSRVTYDKPYRDGQVMHMEGNSCSFYKSFGFIPSKMYLAPVIEYYKSKL